jgi:Delta3,5-Delta2,4-dienoyl-CoA isomerase
MAHSINDHRHPRVPEHSRTADYDDKTDRNPMVPPPPSSRLDPHPLDGEFSALSLSIPSGSPHAVVVALNRPEKRNAISATMWREIGGAFSILGRSGDDCRVVILTGAGTAAFTAGIDMSDPHLLPTPPPPPPAGERRGCRDGNDAAAADDFRHHHDLARTQMAFSSRIRDMQRCFTAVEECPVPVIAAIRGSCIGAGVDLASVCDVRLCSPDASFSVREVRIGLAADVGTLQRLPKVTGSDSRVRELCLTGEFFGADEALRIGFVSRVSDRPLADAIALSREIAANSPVAVVGTKRSLVYSRDHSVADGLDHIASHNALALTTDDVPIAVRSAQRKTIPTFPNMAPHSKL